MVALLFSGKPVPTLAAWVKTKLLVPAWPPAAVVPVLGVDEPVAALFDPLLVSWTTTNTITITPTTAAAR